MLVGGYLVCSLFFFNFVHIIIVNKVLCREAFADFDPVAVSKLNEKKMLAPGTTASSLLSDLKLRGIIENARQISKVYYFSCDFCYLHYAICPPGLNHSYLLISG